MTLNCPASRHAQSVYGSSILPGLTFAAADAHILPFPSAEYRLGASQTRRAAELGVRPPRDAMIRPSLLSLIALTCLCSINCSPRSRMNPQRAFCRTDD